MVLGVGLASKDKFDFAWLARKGVMDAADNDSIMIVDI